MLGIFKNRIYPSLTPQTATFSPVPLLLYKSYSYLQGCYLEEKKETCGEDECGYKNGDATTSYYPDPVDPITGNITKPRMLFHLPQLALNSTVHHCHRTCTTCGFRLRRHLRKKCRKITIIHCCIRTFILILVFHKQ